MTYWYMSCPDCGYKFKGPTSETGLEVHRKAALKHKALLEALGLKPSSRETTREFPLDVEIEVNGEAGLSN
jgi:hypothetical protein